MEKDSGSLIPLSEYRLYMNEMGATTHLVNGAEYEGAYPLVMGTPFWREGFQNGTLSYEGVVYYEVPLALDLVRGEVLTRGPGNQRLRLEKAKVQYLILSGHKFVYQPVDTSNNNTLPEDIYDLLFDGAIKLYAKRSKVISRGLHAADRDSFSSRTAFFLFKDITYYPVSREKDLLDIFRNDRQQLKAFWKENKLDFKREPESFILKTVMYWSGLKQ